MTLWIAIFALACVAALWLARPFLLRNRVELAEAEHAISIYRDQRDELERDARNGLISNEDRDAAEQEIERRALRAAKRLDSGLSATKRAPHLAGAAALCAVAGSILLYSLVGTPGATDQPLAQRREAMLERRAEAGDLESRAMLLVERLQDNPDSFEDWWLLARSYASLGDHASAADAYRNAVELSDDNPAVLSAYAESLTLANGNKVPSAARVIFAQVLQSEDDPRARYYVALAKAQAKDFEGALADWLALLHDSTENAPWVPRVRRDIVNMVRFLDRDLETYLPDAGAAEVALARVPVGGDTSEASEGGQDADGVQAALANDPKDWQAWIRLAELRAGQGEADAARAALDRGREQFAGAPFVLMQFQDAEERLGLSEAPDRAGPTDTDVAAAAQMSESERDRMVRGMVEGLAARLQDEPSDLDGWLMLIRSYAVLQEPEAAQDAVRQAKATFQDTPRAVDRIVRTAENLGVSSE